MKDRQQVVYPRELVERAARLVPILPRSTDARGARKEPHPADAVRLATEIGLDALERDLVIGGVR